MHDKNVVDAFEGVYLFKIGAGGFHLPNQARRVVAGARPASLAAAQCGVSR